MLVLTESYFILHFPIFYCQRPNLCIGKAPIYIAANYTAEVQYRIATEDTSTVQK